MEGSSPFGLMADEGWSQEEERYDDYGGFQVDEEEEPMLEDHYSLRTGDGNVTTLDLEAMRKRLMSTEQSTDTMGWEKEGDEVGWYAQDVDEDKNTTPEVEEKKGTEQHKFSSSESDSDTSLEEGGVLVDNVEFPEMFVPGRIVHIYTHRGVYKASEPSRKFPCLRKISMQGNMLLDHAATAYFDALCEVVDVRKAQDAPPVWQSFSDSDICSCCE